MPETLTPDIEIIEAGHGGGGGIPAGGDGDDGDSGSGLPGIPHQAYYTAIQLALVGIVMFFMALTSSFLVRKGLGDDWVAFALPRVLWFNSLVLLASSVTIEVARRHRREGAVAAFRRWWVFTMALGALFVAGQLVAWRRLAEQGVFLATNPSSSFFYVLTALHALHLTGGIVALFYVAFRHWQRSRITQSIAADLAAIYWHFMDGLWLFLLALLYLGR
jgi:cytochrome c oxidase subunit III